MAKSVCVCDISAEHPVLWHALVLRASDYGVDQCVCDVDESAAATELLRPAPPLSRPPGPLAEAGARLVQQRTSAFVSVPLSLRSSNILLHKYVCVCNCGLDVFLDGQKAPFGPKECWYDTVALCTRPSGLIMLLCPQTSRMQGFMWVFLMPLKQQLCPKMKLSISAAGTCLRLQRFLQKRCIYFHIWQFRSLDLVLLKPFLL